MAFKSKRLWVAGIISALLASTTLVAADKGDSIKDKINFNLGIIPDFSGNLALDTGFDFNYWGNLTAGASVLKTERSKVEDTNKGNNRKITVIKDEITRLQALGYRWQLGKSFILKPNLNGQMLVQKRKLNATDRDKDTFQTEDGNMQSLSGNLSLELWWNMSAFNLYLNGSLSPINSNTDSARGYDTNLIRTTDSAGQIKYVGYTGDYTRNSDTNTAYYDGNLAIDVPNLIGESDLLIGAKMVYIDYSSTSRQAAIFNGAKSTIKETVEYNKLDLTFTAGMEMSFIDLGVAKPIATFNYTLSSFTDASGKDASENIFGFGITLKK